MSVRLASHSEIGRDWPGLEIGWNGARKFALGYHQQRGFFHWDSFAQHLYPFAPVTDCDLLDTAISPRDSRGGMRGVAHVLVGMYGRYGSRAAGRPIFSNLIDIQIPS
jgi:hypothetical protein